MFICHFCKQSSQPNEKLKLIVTKTRTAMIEGRAVPQIVEERPRCAACDPNYARSIMATAVAQVEVAARPAVDSAA